MGLKYVLTRKMNNDMVERLFSALRQSQGGNYNIDAAACLSAVERVLQSGIVYASMFSNVRLEKETKSLRLLNKGERSYRPRCKDVLEKLSKDYVKMLDELQRDCGIIIYNNHANKNVIKFIVHLQVQFRQVEKLRSSP